MMEGIMSLGYGKNQNLKVAALKRKSGIMVMVLYDYQDKNIFAVIKK